MKYLVLKDTSLPVLGAECLVEWPIDVKNFEWCITPEEKKCLTIKKKEKKISQGPNKTKSKSKVEKGGDREQMTKAQIKKKNPKQDHIFSLKKRENDVREKCLTAPKVYKTLFTRSAFHSKLMQSAVLNWA